MIMHTKNHVSFLLGSCTYFATWKDKSDRIYLGTLLSVLKFYINFLSLWWRGFMCILCLLCWCVCWKGWFMSVHGVFAVCGMCTVYVVVKCVYTCMCAYKCVYVCVCAFLSTDFMKIIL